MGKLIKNHLARLIVMTAGAYQIAAALQAFFWPKFFWDFATTNFDYAVKPVPILQTINLLFGILALAWEWPLKKFAGTALHRSIEARLVLFPLLSLTAILMYQSTNAGLYYLIGEFLYFWAYSEGEVVCAKPWTLPKRRNLKKSDSPA
ncbi:Short/branched chain specific acyl-CoA dehydrogenase [Venturia nashicola]|uniref:Short/branched chain specific acyl-CoA dehydrogenase n=1 Tax=Venturia nashicola TaxID=86259 RepID=A0A4Z1PAV3_9PEZI|nr:Short/branched chain specific acyl-CoA dehydrogenase [Venturia nashicola]TLD38445.1 Short/branched chain specific acyl-CoA dehydrogenase [Venturia nashicola]